MMFDDVITQQSFYPVHPRDVNDWFILFVFKNAKDK